MSTISNNSKVAYIYEQSTDTWHPVSGVVNTSVDYDWSGANSFSGTVSFDQVIRAKAGVNNFLNPTERDGIITMPTNGIVAFVRQDDLGNTINQVQYYHNGSWRFVNDSTNFSSQTSSYSLSLDDVGRTVIVDSATPTTVQIPLNSSLPFIVGQRLEIIRVGSGEVSITGESGSVIINSKNNNKKIAAQYAGAVLIKTDTNTWLLIGDLTE